jgi:hypothetical protein
MANDNQILRQLACEYYQFSKDDRNTERRKLHTAVNDLKMIRPVVMIDELPWNEMNINDELTMQCENPFLHGTEWFLRSNIYKYKHMPADMFLRPYIPVSKVVHSTGNGVSVQEKILKTDAKNSIVSHEYTDQFQSEADLEKLKIPVITYDAELTIKQYEYIGEILGDIIPIKIVGRDYFSNSVWDEISVYRGVTNLLMDLIERPEFSHQLVAKLTEIKTAELAQYEALGLFESDPFSLHCTPILTSDLPGKDYDGGNMTRKDIWGRGTAQIFASVSKAMHEEFDIEYMKQTIGQCGLVYYGCCEPLDKKIDIVEKIPNLRKIGVTPWADVDLATQIIGKKYVVSSKPNPAAVGVAMLDKDALKKEIGAILNACKRNGCSCDITLKDISTCSNRPENIFEWERIVMDMVRNY